MSLLSLLNIKNDNISGVAEFIGDGDYLFHIRRTFTISSFAFLRKKKC